MSGAIVAAVPEVSVVVSDPWSLVTDHGSTFIATVRAREGDLMLLEMEGRLYVANPRGDRDEARYNLIPTTEEHSQGGSPWGRDQWRGQPAALLADIRGL
jgi:hypothetical protein